jgi:tRNA nucleotidyltransferase (CCA-adding enzyme)
MKLQNIPTDILEICQTFKKNGFQIYLVGGSVRDLLLNRSVGDYDLATDAYPEQSEALFAKAETKGEEFGTIAIPRKNKPGHWAEITTFRLESEYTAARYPRKIIFVSNLKEDLARRDFTVNALAYDPINHILIDEYEGLRDLKAKILRCVGDPEQKFTEDTLRILRALRFVGQLDFELEENCARVIQKIAASFKLPSKIRIEQELTKIKQTKNSKKSLMLLQKTGILQRIQAKIGSTHV